MKDYTIYNFRIPPVLVVLVLVVVVVVLVYNNL